MTEFVEKNNNIFIDGERFSIDLFRMVEPDYESVGFRVYIPESNPPGLTVPKHIIVKDGNQIPGPLPWEDGDRYLGHSTHLRHLQEQQNLDEEIRSHEVEKTLFDSLPYDEKRRREYPPIEDLVVAMWEQQVESKSKRILEIQLKRKEVKEKYPKEQ